jgi:hypothetical protein
MQGMKKKERAAIMTWEMDKCLRGWTDQGLTMTIRVASVFNQLDSLL